MNEKFFRALGKVTGIAFVLFLVLTVFKWLLETVEALVRLFM